MRSKCLEESSGGVKKEISAFSSTPKLSFIWLTRLSAMKALRDPCVHTTLLSPFRRVSQDVLIKQAAKSFTPYCCNLLSSYICVLLIRVTSLRYNSGSKYQYVVLTQRCAPPQTRFLRIRKVRTKGRLSREWRSLRCHNTAITSTDCIINRFIRFILLIFLFLTALRRQNGAHDVNTDGEPVSKYQGDYNLNAGQNSVYHAPNTGEHSYELGSFPNGGYAG